MNKITDYKIVRGCLRKREGFSGTFEEYVQEAIKEGWQPFGGVAVEPGGFHTEAVHYQVMVKYE